MIFRRVTIIGVGLIGGSIARGLKLNQLAGQITGCCRSRDSAIQALHEGTLDDFATDPAKAVVGADLVILATPIAGYRNLLKAIKDHLSADTLITDVGSVKSEVSALAEEVLGEHYPRFVPAHPVAGTEKSGYAASFATLFMDRWTILCPGNTTKATATAKITKMWQLLGAKVAVMEPFEHDAMLSLVSHLPHVIAYQLVAFVGSRDQHGEYLRLAAGGFYDFTRIASSDPNLWKDICLQNRGNLIKDIRDFSNALDLVAKQLEDKNIAPLLAMFEHAHAIRNGVANYQSPKMENK